MLGPGRSVFETLGGYLDRCLLELYQMQIIQSNAHPNESKDAHSHASRTHSNVKSKVKVRKIACAKRTAVPEVHSGRMR